MNLSQRYKTNEAHGPANVLLAWHHYLKGSTDLATQALTAGVTHIRDVNLGFSILGQRLATKLKDIQTARQYVQQQWEKSVTPAARASTLLTQSRIETELGDTQKALKALDLAYRLTPSIHILLRAFELEHQRRDVKACKLRLNDIRKAFPAASQLVELEKKYEALKRLEASKRSTK